MRKIFIVRHATAQEKNGGLPDFERSLVKKGEKEAAAVSGHLAGKYPAPDLMVSSYANRAIETAHRFAEAFGFSRQRIRLRDSFTGDSGPEDLLAEIRKQPDRCRSLMLFGHDPALSRLSAYLVEGFKEELPKAGVVVAEFSARRWRDVEAGSGKLLEFVEPDRIKTPRKTAPSAGEGEAEMRLPLGECGERRIRAFLDLLASVSLHPSAESIHEMRVALKRLRACFNFLDSIDPEGRARRRRTAARKLMRAAGRVRNLQVVETAVRETAKSRGLELSEFYNWLKAEESRKAGKLGRACGKFSGKQLDSAWKSRVVRIGRLDERCVKSRMAGSFIGLIKEIRGEQANGRDVRKLHFLRTRTKEARYTLEILQECGLTGDGGIVLNDRLKAVHQILGRWHDDEVVLEALGAFRKRRDPGRLFSPKSYLEFSKLTRVRKDENRAAFEDAWAALRRFLGRGFGRKVLLDPPS